MKPDLIDVDLVRGQGVICSALTCTSRVSEIITGRDRSRALFVRFCVRQGEAREPVDRSDPEGHRQGGFLPLLLPLVDSGDVESHLLPAVVSLPAAG